MLSITQYFGCKIKSEELYPMIKQAGFDGTTLWWGDQFDADYRKHPEIARAAGLFVENVHTPFSAINNLWSDTIEGNELTEHLLQCVTDCAEFEIPTMVMHLSSGDEPPPFNALGLDRVKRIVEKAERKNVNIALENLRRTEYLHYALENIHSTRLGFCYDSGHHHCRTPGDELPQKYGSRLMALHLHDNDSTDDQHLLPFDSTINWQATMQRIKATGYKGAITLEVVNSRHEDLSPQEFLRIAYDRAKRLAAIK